MKGSATSPPGIPWVRPAQRIGLKLLRRREITGTLDSFAQKVRARLRRREHSVNHGTVRLFRGLPHRATNPLDSCNENLPKEHIHRKYASCPAGTTAPGFWLPPMLLIQCNPWVAEKEAYCFGIVI